MGLISLILPTVGQPNSSEAPKVSTALTMIQTAINGNLDSANIAQSVLSAAGVSDATNTRRGSSIIAASESRTNTAYGTLPTPDQVTGIVLPTAGLIYVSYQATWQSSVGNAARAAVFLGANQLKAAPVGTPTVLEASGGASANLNYALASSSGGLVGSGFSNYAGDVTTGQLLGVDSFYGVMVIFAAAGTYTISVQFKASSGSVTASNRRLYVEARGF